MNIYAHRGDSGLYPENTMLAFQKAAETGCDGIELDVQVTKDGKLVVIHDETVDRTTDGTGFVRDYTYQELSRFDAGVIKNGAFGFQPVPLFEEYCQWAAGEKLITNIEIKSNVFYYEDIEEKTLTMVRNYGLGERVVISSFNHMSLVRVQQLDKNVKTGALVSQAVIGNIGCYCQQFQIPFYHPNMKILTKEIVEDCRKRGIGINTWTINDMDMLEKARRWKCAGIITNYPEVCRRYLGRQGQVDWKF